MKKLLTLALGTLLACTMSACGAKKSSSSEKESEGKNYSKVVLEADNNTFHAVGGWGEWAMTAENEMEATSVYEVSKLSEAVADKLAAKGEHLLYLYVFEGAVIGTKDDSGWTSNAKVNGEVKAFDGSATLKAIRGVYDAASESYSDGQWIPNPVSGGAAHTESLSDNLFISPWKEEKDADGFSWADNPVVTDEGGGTYTVVVAQYDTASTAEVAEFGMAAIKTA